MLKKEMAHVNFLSSMKNSERKTGKTQNYMCAEIIYFT
jgi:hypothetical protein